MTSCHDNRKVYKSEVELSINILRISNIASFNNISGALFFDTINTLNAALGQQGDSTDSDSECTVILPRTTIDNLARIFSSIKVNPINQEPLKRPIAQCSYGANIANMSQSDLANLLKSMYGL